MGNAKYHLPQYNNDDAGSVPFDNNRIVDYGAHKQKGYYDLTQSHEEETDDSTESEPRYGGAGNGMMAEMQYHDSDRDRPRARDDSVFLSVSEPKHEKQKTKSHGRKPAVFVHMQ